MVFRIPEDTPWVARPAADDAADAADGLDYVTRALAEGEQRLQGLLAEQRETGLSGKPAAAAGLLGRLDGKGDALLQAAPSPAARNRLTDAFSGLRQRAGVQLAAAETVGRQHARAGNAEKALSVYAGLARKRPEEAATHYASGLGVLERMGQAGTRADAVATRLGRFRAEVRDGALASLAETDPDNALTRFQGGALDGLLADDDDRDALGRTLRGKVTAAQADGVRARDRATLAGQHRARSQRLGLVAAFEDKLAKGEARHTDIIAAVHDGRLDATQGDRLRTRLGAWQDSEDEKDARVRAMDDALLAGDPVDASDPETADAIGLYYERAVKPLLADLDPAQAAKLEDRLVGKTGFLPSGLAHTLRGDLLSGAAPRMAAAAKRLIGWAKDGQANLTALPDEERARALAVGEFAHLDVAPARMIELGRQRFQRASRPLAAPQPPRGSWQWIPPHGWVFVPEGSGSAIAPDDLDPWGPVPMPDPGFPDHDPDPDFGRPVPDHDPDPGIDPEHRPGWPPLDPDRPDAPPPGAGPPRGHWERGPDGRWRFVPEIQLADLLSGSDPAAARKDGPPDLAAEFAGRTPQGSWQWLPGKGWVWISGQDAAPGAFAPGFQPMAPEGGPGPGGGDGAQLMDSNGGGSGGGGGSGAKGSGKGAKVAGKGKGDGGKEGGGTDADREGDGGDGNLADGEDDSQIAENWLENLFKSDKERDAEREIETMTAEPGEQHRPKQEASRQWAIRNGRDVKFDIKPNPKEKGDAPIYREHEVGAAAVRDNHASIEEAAKKYGVDPKLLRAVIYVENADGNRHGFEKTVTDLGFAKTLFPMNINPKLWEGMGGVQQSEFKDPARNIQAGAALLAAIRDRIDNPTPAKIGSIYNYTGRENVSSYGARIQRVFDEMLWDR